jgi:hypothetical protein
MLNSLAPVLWIMIQGPVLFIPVREKLSLDRGSRIPNTYPVPNSEIFVTIFREKNILILCHLAKIKFVNHESRHLVALIYKRVGFGSGTD